MRAVIFDDHGPISEGEVVKFREKPSALLYGFEATRVFVLFFMCFGVIQVLLLHFAKGASLTFLTKLVLLVGCMAFLVFLLVVVLIAFGIVFIVTSDRVIVRIALLGASCRELSIPIEDIKSLEVRRYSPRYGSIYLERYKDLYETLPRRPVTLKQGRASIWSSSPMSWPPLTGFYGFRNYDAFARLIVDLRTGTHFIQSEDFGGLDG